MKFVLAASGTHGDVNPYLGVALGLKARGHSVTIATCASYQAKVEKEGLQFHPLRPDLAHLMNSSPETSARGNDLRRGTEYILKTLVLPRSRETYDDLLSASRGADLLVIHPVLFPAPLVAEKLGIRWISVILSPGIFLSAYDPPLLPPLAWFHGLRRMGPIPHRYLYRWIDRVTRSWMRPLNELRRDVGLPASTLNPAREGMISPFGTLAWFSPLLGSSQPDWPQKTEITGFVFFDKASPDASGRLSQFLDDGDPPVVFTLGTSAVTVAGDFYRHCLKVVRERGWRGVLLTGADPRNHIPPADLSPSVCAVQYASYSQLFPRAAAIVHSGGIGTIAQALRAGVPSLVVPHAADQPDNAYRLTRIGAGRTLPRNRYTARRAAAELTILLKEPRYRQRAQAFGRQIRKEDGVTKACQALERHAKG